MASVFSKYNSKTKPALRLPQQKRADGGTHTVGQNITGRRTHAEEQTASD